MVTSEKGNEAKVTPIDFRTKIENISLFPYTCIGKILCKFVDGRGKAHIKKGTASKIGSNILLTAAHVIFCPEM
jgi:V8-like Glu-specific endopeptidase